MKKITKHFPKLRIKKHWFWSLFPHDWAAVFPLYYAETHLSDDYRRALGRKFPLIKALNDDDIEKIIKILKRGFKDFYVRVEVFTSDDIFTLAVSPLDIARSKDARRLLLHHGAKRGKTMYEEDQRAYSTYMAPIWEKKKAQIEAKKCKRAKMTNEYCGYSCE